MAAGRVVIFPCGGIKRVEATVARVASYIVNEELLPDETMIMCVPAFLRGVPEDVFMIQKNPTVVLDCHEESCGSHLMHLMGLTPAARVFVPDLARVKGLSPGQARQELDSAGLALARATADLAAQAARFMLSAPGYLFEPQVIDGYNRRLARGDFDPAVFGWREVRPGLQVPAGMPAINLS